MRAIVSHSENQPAQLNEVGEPDRESGDVLLEVTHSSVNFKDGLALAGRGIVRRWPTVLGIDIVGTVAESASNAFSVGDRVTLNGAGAGEVRDGGFAERARVSSESLIRIPDSISSSQAAAIGTAGFTATIAVLALADLGVLPDGGDVLVTGAAGGVGSLAINLLSRRGYRVVASTGRAAEQSAFLSSLGAAEVIDRSQFSDPIAHPLQRERWGAAVDSIGSHTLANVLAQTRYGGVVVSNGMAQGIDLPATVLPFILRAITLVGANSVDAPRGLRERAWATLGDELDLQALDSLTAVVGLGDTIAIADEILHGRIRGRTVVQIA
ncbi:oxidoreductase [Herbiconiux sp. CPCC 203407]|uniref:Oxidoreductase n=1 Tax=Herbiconiux oxytropis TaxID=2970915 RepID=A0AA42BWN5_9MICO|nr:MDR family oxidoreductase [Herbiconiux oxytropis]MCS5721675.1 oxidoreductase [Herbiconiux oxytropis]MCS5726698.1 oxidoreductase [Herbiconiux oxytropis]